MDINKVNKKNSIVMASVLVMAVNLFSKILGFLRQTVIATVFGADINTDIYFTSSDFMIGVAGALTVTFTTALVSHYIRLKVRNSPAKANKTASKVLILFTLISVGIYVILFFIAPVLSKILGVDYSPAELEKLTYYLRIFALSFVFSAIQSIIAAVLNSNDSFVPTKCYGLFLNPLAILFMFLFGDTIGIGVLLISFIIANIAYIIFLGLCSIKHFKFYPTLKIWDIDVKTVFLIALPLLLANIFMQFNNIVDKIICNYLGEGIVSAYSYAYTLEQFVTAIITATFSLILYSQFSNYVARQSWKEMNQSLLRSIAFLSVILIPISLITIVCADDIVSIIYLRGKFTAENADMTRWALIGFGVGFPLVAIREMLIRAHFSFEDSKMPMIGNCFAVCLNAFFSVLLARVFESLGIPGIFGVAIATSLAALFPIILLHSTLKRHLEDFSFKPLIPLYIKISVSGIICLIIVIILHNLEATALLRFFISAASGLIIYFILLAILNKNKTIALFKYLKNKFKSSGNKEISHD